MAWKTKIETQYFADFQQWVDRASLWLTAHPKYDGLLYTAICFDMKGRQCKIGKDFMLARDEGAFPVMWLWPDQVGTVTLAAIKVMTWSTTTVPMPGDPFDALRTALGKEPLVGDKRDLEDTFK